MTAPKIKVVLVARWPVGGIRTYLRYVYGTFDPQRYSITLIAPHVSEIPALLDDLRAQSIRFVALKENPGTQEFIGTLFSVLRKEKPHIIHSHGLTAGLYSILPALVFRIPHLVTIHDVFNREQFNGIKGLLKKTLLIVGMPLLGKIHAVSNDVKNNLFEFIPSLKLTPTKISVILNGIETERFLNAQAQDLRKELMLDSKTFLIGFLGRFMEQKGFLYLVDALDNLTKKYTLKKRPIILTFGAGCFIREEKIMIDKKGLSDYFRFLPFSPNIAPVLKGLDVVVMPSLWEACGLVALETMVAGIPIIGTDCIGLREVLKDTPSAIVPVKDSPALAQAILRELNTPSKQTAQQFSSEAGRRFDVKKHTLAIQEIIQRLTKELKHSPAKV